MSDFHVPSYPSVYAIGHAAIRDIFDGEVTVQEKIDGSQFSFGKTLDGELVCRSKGKQLILDAPEKMFNKAVAVVRELEPLLKPGWIYRGEFLSTPKHNTLAYGRVPKDHIILFDVTTSETETYLPFNQVQIEGQMLGLEVVPTLFQGRVENFEMFQSMLEHESILGGVKIEGVVVKNYARFTPDKKTMMGKYVSEAFREKHQTDWKERNPNRSDVIQLLTKELTTEARWQKAVQHLQEAGKLEGSPRDIGLLIREVPADILKEEEQEIKDRLFKFFWPHIQRGVTNGLPDWYKNQLAASAFEDKS